MDRLAKLAQPKLLLAAALLASGVVLIAWQSHLTFVADDWDLLIHRRGFSADVFLDPHARHIIITPTAIYKAIESTLGMDSLTPFAVVSTGAFLATVALLFVYLRTRVGEWTALIAVMPILFMGTAYEDLLAPFQIGYFGSLVFGLAALLALQRRDATGDAIACVSLIASLTFSEVAVPFLAGAAVAIALDRGPLHRAYVVATPALFYAAWYAGWASGPNSLSFENVATSPRYMLDGIAASLGSYLGAGPAFGDLTANPLDWQRPLLVGAVVAAAFWLRSRGKVSPWLPVAVILLLSFWFITAANTGLGRPATASRYQLVGAIFIVMVAAELAAGTRLRWRGLAVLAAVAAVATVSNLSILHRSYKVLADITPVARGGLSGLEISAPLVDPGFLLTPENSGGAIWFNQVDAARYLSAADKFGSPAYTPDQLATAPEGARVAADDVLAAALKVRLRGATGSANRAGPNCSTVRPAPGAGATVQLPSYGAFLRPAPGTSAALRLGRFSSSFPVDLGTLTDIAFLITRHDLSMQPWKLLVSGAPVTVCDLR
jgi:hypothetical protein